jgi:hypothetical protein
VDAPRLVLKPEPKNTSSPLRHLVPLLVGFGAGLALALTLAWGIMTPAQIVGSVESVRPQDKERYIVLVSMSYALNSDFDGAQRRLSLLKDRDVQGSLRSLAERYTSELRPVAQRSSLAKLAIALGADSVTLRVYISTTTPTPRPFADATPQSAAVSGTSAQASLPARPPNPTALPTARPTPTQLDFRLFERIRLTCQQDTGPKPHVAIFIQDAAGKGLPGVRVRIQWNDGEDTFFTGLKSADPGYAEYEVQAGKSYSVSVLDGTSQTVLGLNADALDSNCPTDGKEHFRAWRVIFRRIG